MMVNCACSVVPNRHTIRVCDGRGTGTELEGELHLWR
jgi:hypothetical protein